MNPGPRTKTKLVKIERGKYSPYFQVARAWLSASSALATIDAKKAASYIDLAIKQLTELRNDLARVATR